MWIKPTGDQAAYPVYDVKGLDPIEPVPELYAATLEREFCEGDLLLFAGVNACVEDISGLSRVRLKDLRLDHLAFFELTLSDHFPSDLMVEAFEHQFSCRVRYVNRDGNTLHRERGLLKPFDVLTSVGADGALSIRLIQGANEITTFDRQMAGNPQGQGVPSPWSPWP